MNVRKVPRLVGLASALAVATAQAGANRPNVVWFLVDDLGWADLSCYGSSFYETPNVDHLAASGVRFTQAYTPSPVCSPTRASLLTGRHPVRVGITDWIPGMKAPREARFETVEDRSSLALEETTIAELLRPHGYQTWYVGKWHLGGEGFDPTQQGFEVNVAGCHLGHPPSYFSPYRLPTLPDGPNGEYLEHRLVAEASRLLEHRDPTRPFFLYYASYNVHTPIHAAPGRVEHFRAKASQWPASPPAIPERRFQSRPRQDHPEYASMVAAIDDALGALLERLERMGLATNTIVIFTSDNGGLCTSAQVGPTCNLPLRSGKGWLYEGGIRVPLILRVPGLPGGRVCDTPVWSPDLMPTVIELCGLPLRPDLHADGVSLVPLLRGDLIPPRTFYWHYPHYHGAGWTPGAAIRQGPWKLIEFYEEDRVELYDLDADPGEQHNVASAHPERVEELRRRLREWQSELHAQMPRPSPARKATAQ